MSRVTCDESKQKRACIQRGLVTEERGPSYGEGTYVQACARTVAWTVAYVLALEPHNRGSTPYITPLLAGLTACLPHIKRDRVLKRVVRFPRRSCIACPLDKELPMASYNRLS